MIPTPTAAVTSPITQTTVTHRLALGLTLYVRYSPITSSEPSAYPVLDELKTFHTLRTKKHFLHLIPTGIFPSFVNQLFIEGALLLNILF